MSSPIKALLLAAGSLAATLGVFMPESAIAGGYFNQSAANCAVIFESIGYSLDPDGEAVITEDGFNTIFICALMNDDEHPVTAIDQIQVFLEDRSSSTPLEGQSSMWACFVGTNWTGGSCTASGGTSDSFTGTAQVTLTGISETTAGPGNIGYLWVVLPPAQNSNRSLLSGYSMLFQ